MEQKQKYGQSAWVFPGMYCHQRATCQTAFRKTRQKAGFSDLKIHHLRYTFASLALQGGSDIGAVSKLLGHSSIKVTMEIYHHLNPDHARAVIEGLPESLPEKKGK